MFLLERLIGFVIILTGVLLFRRVHTHRLKGYMKDAYNFKGYFGAFFITIFGILIWIGKVHILQKSGCFK